MAGFFAVVSGFSVTPRLAGWGSSADRAGLYPNSLLTGNFWIFAGPRRLFSEKYLCRRHFWRTKQKIEQGMRPAQTAKLDAGTGNASQRGTSMDWLSLFPTLFALGQMQKGRAYWLWKSRLMIYGVSPSSTRVFTRSSGKRQKIGCSGWPTSLLNFFSYRRQHSFFRG